MVHTWSELFDVARNLDWHVTYEAKDLSALYELDFSKYSPAGEDFSFYCEADSPEEMVDEIWNYYFDFDIDDHVRSVMDMRGAPGLKELVEDAEAIEEMVLELHNAMRDYVGGTTK